MLLVCVEESVSLPTCPEHYYSLPVTVDLYTLLVIILLTMLQEAVGDTLEELWISYNNVEKLKGVTVLSKLKVSSSVCSNSCSWLSLVPRPRGRSGNEAIHNLVLYPGSSFLPHTLRGNEPGYETMLCYVPPLWSCA